MELHNSAALLQFYKICFQLELHSKYTLSLLRNGSVLL